MRIVVDVSPLALPRTGIGNYVRGMVGGLAAASGDEHQVVAFSATGLPGRRRIEAALAGLALERRLAVLPYARGLRSLWSRAGWPPVERLAGRLDVFHFSDWMYPAQRGGLRATTIHDLVPLRFPEWTEPQTRRMHGAKYENARRTCGLVVANSEFTARDIVERLGVPEERVRIAYPGIDPLFGPDGGRSERGCPYVLTVSTLEPRKNLGTLVAAFLLLRSRRPELELVIAGAGRAEPAAPGVVYAGFVPDEELARLYRGAAAFAYPSRFEGFGIPVVEALASGVPAVVSAHPSLDEAAGSAALRADPESPEAWSDALERALEAGDDVRARGIEQAARFTWEACGQAVLHGYLTFYPSGTSSTKRES